MFKYKCDSKHNYTDLIEMCQRWIKEVKTYFQHDNSKSQHIRCVKWVKKVPVHAILFQQKSRRHFTNETTMKKRFCGKTLMYLNMMYHFMYFHWFEWQWIIKHTCLNKCSRSVLKVTSASFHKRNCTETDLRNYDDVMTMIYCFIILEICSLFWAMMIYFDDYDRRHGSHCLIMRTVNKKQWFTSRNYVSSNRLTFYCILNDIYIYI